MPNQTTVGRAFAASIAVSAGLTALIAALSPFLASVPHLADKGPFWYYWQLPERTVMGRTSAWVGYALHQLSLWIVVVLMMREKPHLNKLSPLNVAALGINLAFVLAHIAQTHMWYDGLAQDVPVWSSQYSVIVMLVIILYQMTAVRGLFLGRKVAFDRRAQAWVGKWHGLYIAWALVYTFWFHPTEGDFGIVFGFAYMFLLLTQLSFANTGAHFSKGWIVVLEVMVGLHGPAIAIQKSLSGGEGDAIGPGSWIMFASGFLFMFVFTGQFALRLKAWQRAAIFFAYGAMLVGLYSWRGFNRIYEVLFIPAALYGGTFALAAVAKVAGMLMKPKGTPGNGSLQASSV